MWPAAFEEKFGEGSFPFHIRIQFWFVPTLPFLSEAVNFAFMLCEHVNHHDQSQIVAEREAFEKASFKEKQTEQQQGVVQISVNKNAVN